MHGGPRRIVAAVFVLSLCAWSARADVRLHAVFSDHAVVQRDRPLPVWGWADPGEEVTVEFAGHAVRTAADDGGRWKVTLPPLPAAADPATLVVRGANTLTVKDVLVGDLWLCSGQSNMSISAGHYSRVPEVKADLAAARLPLIRHFGVVEHFADEPQQDVKGEWLPCTPQTAGRFCAVGFYFAREVQPRAQVPIGIVRAAKGSTGIEMWLSQETLLDTPALAPFADTMRESLDRWERDRAAAVAAGVQPGSEGFPPFPFGEKARQPRCVTLHNGMLAPLAGLSIRGGLWYQGEGNAADRDVRRQYVETTRALVAEWRRLFGDERLPFYFVQLPGYQKPTDDPAADEPWARMREAQRACLTIPHTGMAVTLDLGEDDDIHPRNKADVGERLARLALRNEYGMQDLVASGPLFREMRIEGGKARLFFDATGGGLMAGRKVGRDPVAETAGAPLRWFAVAGADRTWHWADATIDGETVVVGSPEVAAPVAVRYASAANPEGANLYNRAGVPASPFRTDDW